jgi:hypothetical protein
MVSPLTVSAVRQAEQLRLTDRLWLGDLIGRYPRRPGVPALRALIEDAQRGLSVVRSELEERFQALLLDAAVPMPATTSSSKDTRSTAPGSSSASSSSSTAAPRTTRATPSRPIALGTAASVRRAGVWSASRGGSCSTPRGRSSVI